MKHLKIFGIVSIAVVSSIAGTLFWTQRTEAQVSSTGASSYGTIPIKNCYEVAGGNRALICVMRFLDGTKCVAVVRRSLGTSDNQLVPALQCSFGPDSNIVPTSTLNATPKPPEVNPVIGSIPSVPQT